MWRRAVCQLSQVVVTWAMHRRLQRSASNLHDEPGLPHLRADLLQQLSEEAADDDDDDGDTPAQPHAAPLADGVRGVGRPLCHRPGAATPSAPPVHRAASSDRHSQRCLSRTHHRCIDTSSNPSMSSSAGWTSCRMGTCRCFLLPSPVAFQCLIRRDSQSYTPTSTPSVLCSERRYQRRQRGAVVSLYSRCSPPVLPLLADVHPSTWQTNGHNGCSCNRGRNVQGETGETTCFRLTDASVYADTPPAHHGSRGRRCDCFERVPALLAIRCDCFERVPALLAIRCASVRACCWGTSSAAGS